MLVLNAGSSSLKYRLLDGSTGAAEASGPVERIGEDSGTLTHTVGGERAHARSGASRTSRTRCARRSTPSTARARDRPRRPGRGRSPRRARRRPLLRAGAGRRPAARHRRGARPARAAAQPGQPGGPAGGATALPRRAAGRGLRHRVPPDDARARLHLRRAGEPGARSTGSAATASTARRTPSSPAAPPSCSAAPVEDTNLVVLHLGNGASAAAVRGGGPSTPRWGSRRSRDS